MAFSLKKLQQHSRRQGAARRSSTTVAHPPILRNAGVISVTTYATLASVPPALQSSMIATIHLRLVWQYLRRQRKGDAISRGGGGAALRREEEGVQFGHDAGHEPAEPTARCTRMRASRRREVAMLSSDIGAYWSAATPRVRRAPLYRHFSPSGGMMISVTRLIGIFFRQTLNPASGWYSKRRSASGGDRCWFGTTGKDRAKFPGMYSGGTAKP